jgi:flagellar M-ring protein FliF
MAADTATADSSESVEQTKDGFQTETPSGQPEGAETHLMESGHPAFTGFGRLGIIRQIALMVGFAAIVATAVAIVIWSQETPYKPLMGSLQGYNAKEILNTLDASGIDYRINTQTGVLSVPQDVLHEARMALAGTVLAEDPTVGLELIDKEQGLGTSQFIENARYRRGLEGELARTISSLNSIRAARVHLALPKQSVFVRDAREPRASVFLEIYHGQALSREQANAIMSLVASSIPELKMTNVTLVDQRGNLLSKEDANEEDLLATKRLAYTQKIEDGVLQRLNRLLEPLVGIEHFKAEVAADIDFTEMEKAEEQFNPDLIALRSEQTLNQESILNPQGGVPGALTNQPPGAAEVPEQVIDPATGLPMKPMERKSEATRNYEIDRTMSYTRKQSGRIQRLTVAVAINDKIVLNEETGETTLQPWSAEDLTRIEALVKDTVGFNAARGDSVSVVNSTFLGSPEALELPSFWTQPWFWDVVKQVLGGIFILILIFGVIRPVVRGLMARGKEEEESDMDDLGDTDDLFGDDRVTLATMEDYSLPGASEGYERQLDALKALLAEDPGRVSLVVKRWLNE